jgi:hypothetical protein
MKPQFTITQDLYATQGQRIANFLIDIVARLILMFVFGNYELGTTFIFKTSRRQSKRLRIEQDDTRLGFEVDYDRIIFSALLEVCKIKRKLFRFQKPILFTLD